MVRKTKNTKESDNNEDMNEELIEIGSEEYYKDFETPPPKKPTCDAKIISPPIKTYKPSPKPTSKTTPKYTKTLRKIDPNEEYKNNDSSEDVNEDDLVMVTSRLIDLPA